jgi:hypothetical protein
MTVKRCFDLTGITDQVTAANSNTLSYSPANRLASASGAWGANTFTYDTRMLRKSCRLLRKGHASFLMARMAQGPSARGNRIDDIVTGSVNQSRVASKYQEVTVLPSILPRNPSRLDELVEVQFTFSYRIVFQLVNARAISSSLRTGLANMDRRGSKHLSLQLRHDRTRWQALCKTPTNTVSLR